MNAPRYYYHDQVSDRVLGPVSVAKLRLRNLASLQGPLQVCREATDSWMPIDEAMRLLDDEHKREVDARKTGSPVLGCVGLALALGIFALFYGRWLEAKVPGRNETSPSAQIQREQEQMKRLRQWEAEAAIRRADLREAEAVAR